MATKTYIPCRVLPGFFESEYYVVLKDGSAYIVDKANVRVKRAPEGGGEGEGKVLAYLIEDTPEGALVELTGEPVGGGLRTLVPKEDLEYVAAA
jgi:hypothetical protein